MIVYWPESSGTSSPSSSYTTMSPLNVMAEPVYVYESAMPSIVSVLMSTSVASTVYVPVIVPV